MPLEDRGRRELARQRLAEEDHAPQVRFRPPVVEACKQIGVSLAEPYERQYGQYDDYGSDNPDNVVHERFRFLPVRRFA